MCLEFQLLDAKVASGKSVLFQLHLVRIVLSFLKMRPLSSFLAVPRKLASGPAFQKTRIFCTGIWPIYNSNVLCIDEYSYIQIILMWLLKQRIYKVQTGNSAVRYLIWNPLRKTSFVLNWWTHMPCFSLAIVCKWKMQLSPLASGTRWRQPNEHVVELHIHSGNRWFRGMQGPQAWDNQKKQISPT